MLPSAIAAIGFVGKIFIRTSFREGAAVDSNAVGKAKSIPIPGLKIRAKVSAIDMAIAVVNKYKDSVFKLIVPILEVEEIETTPQTREKKTRGTITSLREAINICPTISNKPSVKNSIKINCPISPKKPISLTNFSDTPPTMAKTMDKIILEVRLIIYVISTISKSSLPTPQSGQIQSSGTSSHLVPGSMPSSGQPSSSS